MAWLCKFQKLSQEAGTITHA